MPFFDGVSGQVHYRRWPVDSPRVGLVFLHGRGQHSGHYHRFARALNGSGIDVWAIDHVGHGLTEGQWDETVEIGDLGADAVRLSELAGAALPGLPVAVMGHSLGAAAALSAMQTMDFDGLVLCGTPRSVGTAGVTAPEAPTLVVHGVDDRLAPIDIVREWVARFPRIEMIEYPDAGHDLLHEPVHPIVTAAVGEFLLRLCP